MSESLGPCCGCETMAGVVNVAFLPYKCPIPGRGWGCVVCDISQDGAMAVLCDACAAKNEIRFACRGRPATDGRVPISELTGDHAHVLSKHPELLGNDDAAGDEEDPEEGVCCECGHSADDAFELSSWPEPWLCIDCAAGIPIEREGDE